MKRIYYVLFTFLLSIAAVNAQVTIGSNEDPQKFSILELISSGANAGGLRVPQMTSAQRDAMTSSKDFQTEKAGKAVGLTIINTSTGCIEFWNGSAWVSRCQAEGTGNISVPGNIPDVSALGGSTGTLKLTTDCSDTGNWAISILWGEGAALKNINSSKGTFEVVFSANTTDERRMAIIQTKDACGYSKDFKIYQSAYIAVNGVSIDPSNAALTKIGETLQLKVVTDPVDASNQSAIWTSSDPLIATVDEKTGLVTAVDFGNVTITVATKDGNKTASIDILIIDAVIINDIILSTKTYTYNQNCPSGWHKPKNATEAQAVALSEGTSNPITWGTVSVTAINGYGASSCGNTSAGGDWWIADWLVQNATSAQGVTTRLTVGQETCGYSSSSKGKSYNTSTLNMITRCVKD